MGDLYNALMQFRKNQKGSAWGKISIPDTIDLMKPWKTLGTDILLDTPFCKFKIEKCELPDGRVMPKYYVMEFTDWVNILPITTDGKVILIKQYRQGSMECTWEIPGGAVHPDEGNESLDAARRELEEETGFSSNEVLRLGSMSPNPALQRNQLHTYVALNCKKIGEQNLDPFEEIEVHLFDKAEVLKMIKRGEITHSLIVASLFLALDHLTS
ncbi:MAG: NUDIX hydrolase [Bdellovibrionales bacterium]|nr:NUDIX hydrolase [Bdellovibrionales bacterium]